MQHSPHLFIFNHVIGKHPDDFVKLKNDLLEPQLISLMRDDEQHFIMRWFANFFAFELLSLQNFV